jgi:hypothetical protein
METKLLRQIRVLQSCVLALFVSTAFLCTNSVYPLLPEQRFKLIDAERINIREKSGTLKAALSNSAGFNEGQRAEQAGARLSGLPRPFQADRIQMSPSPWINTAFSRAAG